MKIGSLKNKKVLVTGGAGFIGSNLTKELVSLEAEVIVIDDLSAGDRQSLPPEATLHQADICQLETIESLFKDVDFVFHLAAWPRVQKSLDDPVGTSTVNINGTINVLEAVRHHKVKRLIFSSSSSVYGNQESLLLNEEIKDLRPESPYALQKLIGEQLCQSWYRFYGVSSVSLRYFNVFGPGQSDEGDYALVIAKFLKQRLAGEPLTVTGDGKQTRDFTHVNDVVRANLLAATSPKVGQGEAINIGSNSNRSILDLAEMIGGEVKHIDARVEPRHTLADISKARDLLDWQPKVSLEEGVDQLKTPLGL